MNEHANDPTETTEYVAQPLVEDERLNGQGSGETEGGQLRRQRNEAREKAGEYRQELLTIRLEKLGINPNHSIGVAIMETLPGHDVDSVSIEAIAAHAREKYRVDVDELNI